MYEEYEYDVQQKLFFSPHCKRNDITFWLEYKILKKISMIQSTFKMIWDFLTSTCKTKYNIYLYE